MKIILTASVARLGKIGEVVEVRNGYAKNFLIPNKKAIIFNQANSKVFEAKRAEFEAENEKSLTASEKVKAKIDGKNLTIIENASDDGRLYGSVNSLVIANKINDIVGEKSVIRSQVILKKPIKDIGIYEVILELHSDVILKLKLIVARSESEVESLLKEEKNSNEKPKAKSVEKKSKKAEEKEEVVAEEKVEEVAA